MNRILYCIAAIMLAAAPAQAAGSRPLGVVELFTSQGCNSCPPADAVLASLAHQGDVVALSYHIDYWDYLGWHDTMATPAFTARQYAYGATLGTSSVYTPQAVLNGRKDVNGSKGGTIMTDLKAMAAKGEGLTVPVSMDESDPTKLVIKVGAGAKPTNPVHVVFVYFDPKKRVAITRGENRGRTITYVNTVSDIETIGMWDGKDLRIEMPMSEMAQKKAAGCAVLIQEMVGGTHPGAILGAAFMTEPNNS